jgi:hypothetical protein
MDCLCAKVQETTISFVMSVRSYLCSEDLGFHSMGLIEIGYFSAFRKSIEKIQISLKSDKIDGYFTCKPMYIYDNISLNSL